MLGNPPCVQAQTPVRGSNLRTAQNSSVIQAWVSEDFNKIDHIF